MTAEAPPRPAFREEFEIALICALPKESRAVALSFDGDWGDYGKVFGDENSYKTGWIGRHNVVLAHLPQMGKVAAAQSAAQIRLSFPKIRLALVVGICGGVPRTTSNGQIRLGDVLISTGIVQFDFGRIYPDGFRRKDTYRDNLSRPNCEIRSFLHKLQAIDADTLANDTLKHLEQFCGNRLSTITRPGHHQDKLYASDYRHKHQDPKDCDICAVCDNDNKTVCERSFEADCADLGCDNFVVRPFRQFQSDSLKPTAPVVHFGYLACGDSIMKSGSDRDRIADLENVIGFEMEGAGVWDSLPTIVVKSVCDYADSHKGKLWQEYAAAAAACCAKMLLNLWTFTFSVARPMPPLMTQHTEKARNQCLQSLAFPEMSVRQNKVRDAADGTFAWLPSHPSYASWVTQRRGILWIEGNPGTGKSTLVNHALKLSRHHGRVLASFFFDGTATGLQNTQLGLFRSLLYQILFEIPELLNQLTSLFMHKVETRGNPGKQWNWELKELQDFLKHTVMSTPTAPPIRIFVDALDECGEDTAVEIASFFEDLSSSCNPDLVNPSICFSSRHYPNIRIHQDDDLMICLEKNNSGDIDFYVRQRLERAFRKGDDTRSLVDQINKNASGVFQWVVLVLDMVLKFKRLKRSIESIQTKIHETPNDLDNLYRTILSGISDEDVPKTLKLFRWVCFAKRPLCLRELAFAMIVDADTSHGSLEDCERSGDLMTVDEMDEEVKRLSGGLVETWEDKFSYSDYHIPSRRVRYIHQTVYDFLIRAGLSELSGSSNVVGDGHFQLLRTSLKPFALNDLQEIIMTSSLRPPRKLLERLPFLRYSTKYWPQHAQELETLRIRQSNPLEPFGWPSQETFTAWSVATQTLRVIFGGSNDLFPVEGSNLLHCASWYGLESLVEAILTSVSQSSSVSDEISNINLSAALRSPPQERMTLNTQLSNRIGIDDANQMGWTPLAFAACRGHLGVVDRLLSNAKVHADSRNHNGRTPLHEAARWGHVNVVKRLLSSEKVDVNSKDAIGMVPSSTAAENGYSEIVGILLSVPEIAVNSADSIFGMTALMYAAKNNKVEVVSQLLTYGKSQINARDYHGQTALHYAATQSVEMVQHFLRCPNVGIDAINSNGRTPLFVAAEAGEMKIVNCLLATKRADGERRDKRGDTPLMWMPERCRGSKMEQLHGIILKGTSNLESVTEKDVQDNTQLSTMDEAGVFALKYLRSGNFDVNAKDAFGRNILSWAAEWGYENIVQRVLAQPHQLDINWRDAERRDLITCAVIRRWEGVVDQLLATGRVDSSSENLDRLMWHLSSDEEFDFPKSERMRQYLLSYRRRRMAV